MTVHASCVALNGRAVLVAGPSGSGKSDLALRLLDRGAALVSDDYTVLKTEHGRLLASPPATIEGRIEIRGVGIVERPFLRDVPVALLIDLVLPPDRMPEPLLREFAGIPIPVIGLSALEASAPIKVEAALNRHGLA